jgi:hypothetical protein
MLTLGVLKARLLRDTELFGEMDPYIRIFYKGQKY